MLHSHCCTTRAIHTQLCFHANKDYQEALDHFTVLVKNKAYANSGRLRVNMGNIYFEQKKFSSAIKMYRMALDQIPATAKEVCVCVCMCGLDTGVPYMCAGR